MNTPLPLKSRKKVDSCDVARCRIHDDIQTVMFGNMPVKLCARCRPLWDAAAGDSGEQSANSSRTVPSPPTGTAEAATTAVALVPSSARYIIDGAPAEAADGPIAALMRATTRNDSVTLSYAKEQIVTALEPIKREAEESLAALKNFVIRSQSTLDKACEVLADTTKKGAKVEKVRTGMTKPILALKREVDDWFKPAKGAVLALENRLRGEIETYTQAEEARKVAALKAGEHEAALAMDEPTLSAGVKNRTLWKWRVVNAKLIPPEYWVLDAAKIQTRVDALKAQCDIPGIETYPDTGLSAPRK